MLKINYLSKIVLKIKLEITVNCDLFLGLNIR
jgi:hypothetical protein